MSVAVAVLLAGAAGFCAALAAERALLAGRLRVLRGLAALADEHAEQAVPPPAPRRSGGAARELLRRAAGAFTLGPLRRWAQRALRGTGLPLRPEEFLALCAVATLAGWALGAVLRLPGFVRLLLVTAGPAGPALLARRARAARTAAISAQLGDLLAALGNGLRAGHGLLQAIEGAARQCAAPLGDELRRLLRETAAGMPVEEALLRLQERAADPDLELVVTAVLVQRQVGGNLAEVLDKIAGTIRARVQVKAHLRVVTAQSRLSAWVIALVPVAVFALTTLVAPQVEHVLTGDPLGRALAGGAALLELLGVLAVRKAVAVRY